MLGELTFLALPFPFPLPRPTVSQGSWPEWVTQPQPSQRCHNPGQWQGTAWELGDSMCLRGSPEPLSPPAVPVASSGMPWAAGSTSPPVWNVNGGSVLAWGQSYCLAQRSILRHTEDPYHILQKSCSRALTLPALALPSKKHQGKYRGAASACSSRRSSPKLRHTGGLLLPPRALATTS